MAGSIGDRSRCLDCGAKIVLVPEWRFITISHGVWVHESALRRNFGRHPARGPS